MREFDDVYAAVGFECLTPPAPVIFLDKLINLSSDTNALAKDLKCFTSHAKNQFYLEF